MQELLKYFPDLTAEQKEKFAAMKEAYAFWNERINVISRKDMDNFYERHVLHSLAIVKVMGFKPGARVMDVGTGGGFPGIPLAVMFPETHFTLVDSIGKKITVVNEVAAALNLANVNGIHERAEKINGRFDFIVSRAVTAMPEFMVWTQGKFLAENKHALANGILYLKGGDLREEFSTIRNFHQEYPIAELYSEDFFETKKVVYVKATY